MPEELWTEVHDIVQEAVIKTIPKKKKCKKAKWLSEEALQIAVKRSEVKGKGEKEIHPFECKVPTNYPTIALISHASKGMLKILKVRLQQYVNCELPDVQAGFRKGRGTRDQVANIRWIIKKAREFQKISASALLTRSKPLVCGSQQSVENSSRDGNTTPPHLPPEKSVCRARSNS